MCPRARIYFDCVVGTGLFLFLEAMSEFSPIDLQRFLAYLAAAMVAATLRLRIPGIPTTFSPAFAFVLIAISDLSAGEAVLIACVSVLVQCVWGPPTTRSPRKVVFNLAAVAIGSMAAYNLSRLFQHHEIREDVRLLPVAALVCFLCNTSLVSGMIATKDQELFRTVWKVLSKHTVPYYLLGSLIAAWTIMVNHAWGWRFGLLAVPALAVLYQAYRLYLRKRGADAA